MLAFLSFVQISQVTRAQAKHTDEKHDVFDLFASEVEISSVK